MSTQNTFKRSPVFWSLISGVLIWSALSALYGTYVLFEFIRIYWIVDFSSLTGGFGSPAEYTDRLGLHLLAVFVLGYVGAIALTVTMMKLIKRKYTQAWWFLVLSSFIAVLVTFMLVYARFYQGVLGANLFDVLLSQVPGFAVLGVLFWYTGEYAYQETLALA